MSPQKKVALFSALIIAPLLLAVMIFIIHMAIEGNRKAVFSGIVNTKTSLTVSQVEKELGSPARIEQSETADQTINGSVYHYPIPEGHMKIVFVNGVVFHAEFVSGAKS